MLKLNRLEVPLSGLSFKEAVELAAAKVREARMDLEAERTRSERDAQLRGMVRLVALKRSVAVYDVWLGKVQGRQENKE